MLPFLFAFGKFGKEWRKFGKEWRFALADRGLDMTSHFTRLRYRYPYTFGNEKSRGPWKVLGFKIILP